MGKYDLWVRVRAYLYSICFLTIMTPDFSPCSCCEFYTDLLLEIVNGKIKNQYPTLWGRGSQQCDIWLNL